MDAFEKETLTIGTHDGEFHADDIYACATLIQATTERGQKNPPVIDIVRTRDPQELAQCDVLIDVGMEYNPDEGKFDHHQPEGAGHRKNGIPYAAFGLIWKEVGLVLCDGDQIATDLVDKDFVQVIDAYDNQIPLYESSRVPDIQPGQDIMNFNYMGPTGFDNAIATARMFIEGRIASAKAVALSIKPITESLLESTDKRVLILPHEKINWKPTVPNLELANDAKFVIEPEGEDWLVRAVPVRANSSEKRALLPEELRGIEDAEAIEKLCGVADVKFIHRDGFYARAVSKEAAERLVYQSLDDMPIAA